jgi:hypothetical protein
MLPYESARAFGLFGLLGPVFSVIENFGHPRMIPILPSVFSVFLYSVFGLFGPVFGHDHIDQTNKMAAQVYRNWHHTTMIISCI